MIFPLLPRHRPGPTFSPSFHVVPAASVWEPPSPPPGQAPAPRVRTLRAAQPSTPGTAPCPPVRTGHADRATARREAGRTYLLGAVLGFSVVLGTVYAVNGETPSIPPPPAESVSAVVAK